MSLEQAYKRIILTSQHRNHDLDLSGLDLIEIPSGLNELTHITRLNLSNNKIRKLNIDGLTMLEKLDLSENLISDINGLEKLLQLTELDLGDNNIYEIRGLNTLTKLKSLNLSGNNIAEISGLENLTELTELNLANNEIKEITGLENSELLCNLNLAGNDIAKIKNIWHLSRLKKIYLHINNIRKCEGMERLKQLEFIDLSFNSISELSGLEELTKLKELYLNNNQITNTEGLGRLKNLECLKLQNNLIEAVDGLVPLTQLNNLWLVNNNINEIPEKLFLIINKIYWDERYGDQGIFVGGNPLINPSPEIIEQGNKAVKEYFNQQRRSGVELLNEAKLILLGDGRSGKTSFANRLLGKKLPEESDRTLGVDIVIGEYSFRLANGKDFKINIWDFAGQDKYKTLHQLFYTESSLYVMVAESGSTTTDYDDWFQMAELFGDGSPLVLLLNEFRPDIGLGGFDSNYWKRQFPQLLKEVFTVNLGTKQNFSYVEEYIQLLVQTLPHTKYAFPGNWAAIRRILNERRNEQFINLKEYLEICKNNNLPEREGALILSSILHKVGDCLHYQKNDLLKQFIILKNEWATDAVYKILDDKIVAEEKFGFFDLNDLDRIWSSPEYMDMRPQLLELMKQFKLAYKLPVREEFVTPPLLPPNSPEDYEWPKQDSLELYIDYEFLPKALLTQFIVTRHADIANGRKLVWRHGVILDWPGEARAEVTKTRLQGRDAFRIRTHGVNRKGIMTVILKTYRELHEEYKGIKFNELVPCTCTGCKNGKNRQHYFEFENLQRRLEKGRQEIDCDKSLIAVNLPELLENSFIFEKFREGEILKLKENGLRGNFESIRVLKIFLASSDELSDERVRIEQAIGRKNKILLKKGFQAELIQWEYNQHTGTTLRSQDSYSKMAEQCDVFILLFYSKLGKFTKEEFEKAHKSYSTFHSPLIKIYQKNFDLPKDISKQDADSRFEFIELLQKLGNFPIMFDNTDKLINELLNLIEHLLEDSVFVNKLK